MFEGSADFEMIRHEKPAWIERLKKAGELDGMLVAEAETPRKTVFFIFGYAMITVGLFLLIGALVNWYGIAW